MRVGSQNFALFVTFWADFASPFRPCVPQFSMDLGLPYTILKPTKWRFYRMRESPDPTTGSRSTTVTSYASGPKISSIASRQNRGMLISLNISPRDTCHTILESSRVALQHLFRCQGPQTNFKCASARSSLKCVSGTEKPMST